MVCVCECVCVCVCPSPPADPAGKEGARLRAIATVKARVQYLRLLYHCVEGNGDGIRDAMPLLASHLAAAGVYSTTGGECMCF